MGILYLFFFVCEDLCENIGIQSQKMVIGCIADLTGEQSFSPVRDYVRLQSIDI